MKARNKACIWALIACSLLASAALAASTEGYLWTGNDWKNMSSELKIAYVKGIGNMADVETAVGGKNRAACISKAFVDELKQKTIAQVISEVDNYYKASPDKIKTPVIEVILRASTKVCPPETPSPEKKK